MGCCSSKEYVAERVHRSRSLYTSNGCQRVATTAPIYRITTPLPDTPRKLIDRRGAVCYEPEVSLKPAPPTLKRVNTPSPPVAKTAVADEQRQALLQSPRAPDPTTPSPRSPTRSTSLCTDGDSDDTPTRKNSMPEGATGLEGRRFASPRMVPPGLGGSPRRPTLRGQLQTESWKRAIAGRQDSPGCGSPGFRQRTVIIFSPRSCGVPDAIVSARPLPTTRTLPPRQDTTAIQNVTNAQMPATGHDPTPPPTELVEGSQDDDKSACRCRGDLNSPPPPTVGETQQPSTSTFRLSLDSPAASDPSGLTPAVQSPVELEDQGSGDMLSALGCYPISLDQPDVDSPTGREFMATEVKLLLPSVCAKSVADYFTSPHFDASVPVAPDQGDDEKVADDARMALVYRAELQSMGFRSPPLETHLPPRKQETVPSLVQFCTRCPQCKTCPTHFRWCCGKGLSVVQEHCAWTDGTPAINPSDACTLYYSADENQPQFNRLLAEWVTTNAVDVFGRSAELSEVLGIADWLRSVVGDARLTEVVSLVEILCMNEEPAGGSRSGTFQWQKLRAFASSLFSLWGAYSVARSSLVTHPLSCYPEGEPASSPEAACVGTRLTELLSVVTDGGATLLPVLRCRLAKGRVDEFAAITGTTTATPPQSARAVAAHHSVGASIQRVVSYIGAALRVLRPAPLAITGPACPMG